jgi:vitamin B12 transporter
MPAKATLHAVTGIRSIPGILCLSGALLANCGAFAAEDEPAVKVAPETVVSASRVPTDISKVGSAVTVLDTREIEERQYLFSSDLLRDFPGLNVSRQGTLGANTQIRVRGAEANQVLVLIDGMEANDPANGNEFNFGNLLGLGVSRIEVLRGPQSGLYGPDALAGVISFETPLGKPGLHFDGFTETGSWATVIGGGRVSGGTEKLRFSFFGARARTNGTNISRPTALPFANESDDSANTTLHGRIRAYVTDWLELNFAGRYVRSRIQFDADTNSDGLNNDANRVTLREALQGIAKAKLSFWDGRWQTLFTVGYLTTNNRNYANDVFQPSQKGDRLKLGAQTSYRFRTPGFADAEHIVILALDHEVQNFHQRGTSFGLSTDQDRQRVQTGYVAEYRLALWKRLYLSGVVRYDQQDDFADALTWRGTAAYLLRPTRTKFHTSIGRGFKNPTFTEQYGFFPGLFVGNANLKPETSIGWDAGVEQRLFGKKLVADVTFFQSWLQNEIQTFGFPGSVRNLTGTSRRHGIEFSFTARPFENLTVKGTYTYLMAEEPNGTQEIRRPRHSGSLNVNYRFYHKRANVNLDLQFNGKQRDNWFPPPTFTGRPVTLGGYVLVNVAASFKVTENLEVFGRVQNLLNQRYEDVFSFQAPRIGAFAGIRIKFGAPL